MPSNKEAQHSRGGHRKSRRHSSPERINTARADEEHYGLALKQVNGEDELPASDATFSLADSPAFLRLQQEAHEFQEGLAEIEQQISLFQRPKSSGSLPETDAFAFAARQDREMNVRRAKQNPMARISPPVQSRQRSQSAENTGERPDASCRNGKHRYVASPSFMGLGLTTVATAPRILSNPTPPDQCPRILRLQLIST